MRRCLPPRRRRAMAALAHPRPPTARWRRRAGSNSVLDASALALPLRADLGRRHGDGTPRRAGRDRLGEADLPVPGGPYAGRFHGLRLPTKSCAARARARGARAWRESRPRLPPNAARATRGPRRARAAATRAARSRARAIVAEPGGHASLGAAPARAANSSPDGARPAAAPLQVARGALADDRRATRAPLDVGGAPRRRAAEHARLRRPRSPTRAALELRLLARRVPPSRPPRRGLQAPAPLRRCARPLASDAFWSTGRAHDPPARCMSFLDARRRIASCAALFFSYATPVGTRRARSGRIGATPFSELAPASLRARSRSGERRESGAMAAARAAAKRFIQPERLFELALRRAVRRDRLRDGARSACARTRRPRGKMSPPVRRPRARRIFRRHHLLDELRERAAAAALRGARLRERARALSPHYSSARAPLEACAPTAAGARLLREGRLCPSSSRCRPPFAACRAARRRRGGDAACGAHHALPCRCRCRCRAS